MTLETGTDFFDLAAMKLDWIDGRTRVLAGNVANADTPGYRPKDVAPFASLVQDRLGLATTNQRDIGGASGMDDAVVTDNDSETAPDGNAVSLDRQMREIAADDQAQNVVTTLYKKYLGMTGLALGVSG